MCISDFVINELIGTAIKTNFTNVYPTDMLFQYLDFYVTTPMLEPLFPQLTEIFGERDLSLQV